MNNLETRNPEYPDSTSNLWTRFLADFFIGAIGSNVWWKIKDILKKGNIEPALFQKKNTFEKYSLAQLEILLEEVKIFKETKGESPIPRLFSFLENAAMSDANGKTMWDYIEEVRQTSTLAKEIQGLEEYILPLIAEESLGFSRAQNRKSGARGICQFMPGTAREYGLIVNAHTDERLDPKKSISAAIEYLQDIYELLTFDKDDIPSDNHRFYLVKAEEFAHLKEKNYYSLLRDRYNLQPTDFLIPATINAFNCGELHILNAMKYMVEDSSFREVADSYVQQYGKKGLFLCLKEVYAGKDYKKWQKEQFAGAYYWKQSSNYFYRIDAWKTLLKLLPENAKRNTAILKHGDISGGNHGMADTHNSQRGVESNLWESIGAGGVATILAWCAEKGLTLKEAFSVPQTRRDFLALIGIVLTGGAGGASEHVLSTQNRTEEKQETASPTVDELCNSALRTINDYYTKNRNTFPHIPEEKYKNLFQSKNYIFNKRMGDISYEHLNKENSSEQKEAPLYMYLSGFYYTKALAIARSQNNKKEIAYCIRALAVVEKTSQDYYQKLPNTQQGGGLKGKTRLENETLDRQGITRFTSFEELKRASMEGYVVPVDTTEDYVVDSDLGYKTVRKPIYKIVKKRRKKGKGYYNKRVPTGTYQTKTIPIVDPDKVPYYQTLRPHTKQLLENLALAFAEEFPEANPLKITGLSRDKSYISALRKHGIRASRLSSHMAGTTFDISKLGMPPIQKMWLRAYFSESQKRGEILASDEISKALNSFHIMDLKSQEALLPEKAD